MDILLYDYEVHSYCSTERSGRKQACSSGVPPVLFPSSKYVVWSAPQQGHSHTYVYTVHILTICSCSDFSSLLDCSVGHFRVWDSGDSVLQNDWGTSRRVDRVRRSAGALRMFLEVGSCELLYPGHIYQHRCGFHSERERLFITVLNSIEQRREPLGLSWDPLSNFQERWKGCRACSW